MNNPRPTLSVIIPAYNEAKTVRDVIDRVAASPVDKEILVVDDGSHDGTCDILRSLEKTLSLPSGNRLRIFYQEKNRGKGAAIRRAQGEALGQVTLIQDADLELDPQAYPSLIAPILKDKADVVYGSRFLDPAQRRCSTWHAWGNRTLTAISNLFTGLRLTDMETCYKAFRTELFQSILIEANRFEFEPEITAKIAKRRYRITEIPVTYEERTYSEGKKIGWRDAIQAIRTILKYAFAKGA